MDDAPTRVSTRSLRRYMWLSVVAALLTMSIKGGAAWYTGSVGLLSDALESTVNLVAALIGVWALTLAAKPADRNHPFGHGKAEYFSSLAEGSMILVAATLILYTSVDRLLNPVPVESLGFGVALSAGASVINLVVALVLKRAGRRHYSVTLRADGQHLMTDVWTSIGVVAGVGLVALTDWQPLDPIIAIVVGLNILRTGWQLLRDAVVLLLSSALEDADLARVQEVERQVTDEQAAAGQRVHFLHTHSVQSGRDASIHAFMCVPSDWTVARGRSLAREVSERIAATLPELDAEVYVVLQSHDTHDVPDVLADDGPADTEQGVGAQPEGDRVVGTQPGGSRVVGTEPGAAPR